MADSVATKELVVNCYGIDSFSPLVRVWDALGSLQPKHYAGQTIEGIVSHTKLAAEEAQKALACLVTNDSENGCVQMNFCQEGTAGPFAIRFRQRQGTVPRFVVVVPANATYRVTLK